MIKHIQFNTKLSVSKYRRLVREKPWLGKWDEVSLKDIKDEETGKDGSSTKRRVSDTAKGTGKRRRRSNSNETNTTISTAA